jgi:hypothetical protein
MGVYVDRAALFFLRIHKISFLRILVFKRTKTVLKFFDGSVGNWERALPETEMVDCFSFGAQFFNLKKNN